MTCREKLAIEHPDKIDPEELGGCVHCPNDYGYLDPPDYCGANCAKCWDREIPEENSPTRNLYYEQLEKDCSGTVNEPKILDSGERREFETGAVRDIQEGKGRCDLVPLDIVAQLMDDNIIRGIHLFQAESKVAYLSAALHDFANRHFKNCETMLLEVSKHFEEGAKKYGEYNWQKGIPVHCYIDSAVRHYLKFLRGDKDEPHDRAFVWNIMCCIWTCKHKPELNEYLKKESNDETH